ncbi:hypothetical protein JG688_00016040 [Phytophthora aleatoria]|uniref:Uncharacterized protein n=1 Tax=Phytophthora aleatoria TaxID=2496075 RepID=A0A8J5LWG0_9STRA|nr:hypothetical protein JG688_00016040 [Phytophthora aleatoria]
MYGRLSRNMTCLHRHRTARRFCELTRSMRISQLISRSCRGTKRSGCLSRNKHVHGKYHRRKRPNQSVRTQNMHSARQMPGS